MKYKWSRQIMWETILPLDIFCYQGKPPVPIIDIYLSYWPKRPYGNPQTSESISNVIGCNSQTNAKYLLLKTQLHLSLNMERLIWYLTIFLNLTDQYSQYWKVLCILPKEKGKHQPTNKPCDIQWWPVCKTP